MVIQKNQILCFVTGDKTQPTEINQWVFVFLQKNSMTQNDKAVLFFDAAGEETFAKTINFEPQFIGIDFSGRFNHNSARLEVFNGISDLKIFQDNQLIAETPGKEGSWLNGSTLLISFSGGFSFSQLNNSGESLPIEEDGSNYIFNPNTTFWTTLVDTDDGIKTGTNIQLTTAGSPGFKLFGSGYGFVIPSDETFSVETTLISGTEYNFVFTAAVSQVQISFDFDAEAATTFGSTIQILDENSNVIFELNVSDALGNMLNLAYDTHSDQNLFLLPNWKNWNLLVRWFLFLNNALGSGTQNWNDISEPLPNPTIPNISSPTGYIPTCGLWHIRRVATPGSNSLYYPRGCALVLGEGEFMPFYRIRNSGSELSLNPQLTGSSWTFNANETQIFCQNFNDGKFHGATLASFATNQVFPVFREFFSLAETKPENLTGDVI